MQEVDFSWYGGGRLNACHNAVDRHLQTHPDKVAIVWAGNEPGQYERITYRELKHQVARMANVLKAHGVQKGDRVCIYMPMTPAVAYTMLGVRAHRRGALGGVRRLLRRVPARSHPRLGSAQVVVTANEAPRGPKAVHLKSIVDQALEGLTQVQTVLVSRRTETTVPMKAGRDLFLEDEMQKHRSTCPVEWMSSEDPLFILYTSGSTGKPKGVLHTTAGYLVYAAMTHEYVFDLRPDDVFFCTADVGWITGHSYLLYGPLVNGVTTVIFESTPMYPDPGRMWQVVDDLQATILYTSPTALRALIREGDEWVKKSSRKSLRILGQRGRAHQPRGVALVPRRGGRGPLRRGGHVVADGDGRHPHHPAPGRHAHQAGQRHPAVLRHRAGAGGREGERHRGQRRLGQPVPQAPLAGSGAHHLGRPPALPRDVLLGVPRHVLHG